MHGADRSNINVVSAGFSQQDYQDFQRYLEEACGIVLGDNKQYLVSSRLNRVLAEFSMASLGELIGRVRSGSVGGLRERVIEAMTTNETSWFRDNYPFDILRDTLLPELGRNRAQPIRIWSAACSSGQEPYSISMVVEEYRAKNPGTLAAGVQVVATDISPAILRDAKAGIYDSISVVRGLSPERKQRFFSHKDDRWEVRSEVKARVQFRDLNLMQSYSLLGRFDMIFCRNVLIYFSTESKRDILSRMARALNPRGYLFLGGSESIANYSEDFELVRMPRGVVYRLKGNA